MKASSSSSSSVPPRRGVDALVLAGGVAKGAFTAGAVRALAEEVASLRVRRIVATSAGALNGVFLAAALRDGRALSVAAAELAALWREKATVSGAFDITPTGIATRTGLSTSAKLLGLMRQYIHPARQRRPVDFRVVTTNAAGKPGRVGDHAATTFEHVARFGGEFFDHEEGLEEVFRAVCASAAFPVAFQPMELALENGPAPCFDGGLTDNAPVKHALEDPGVNRVFVVAPYPSVYEGPPHLRGGALLVHLADILVQERLYRDLREAHATNAALLELERIVPEPRARAAVLDAIGWRGRRPVELIELRPAAALAGGAFDGFVRVTLRESYLAAGEQAVHAWLDAGGARIARKAG